MAMQEAALYGDLVLALRDHAAERLAALDPGLTVDEAGAQVDEFIRAWFFTPRANLYGAAPREIIWREQLGEGNPVPRQVAAEAFPDCDCPICALMRAEIEAATDDEAHGHFWTYCPDSCLLDRYDPEGSEARWAQELAEMRDWVANQEADGQKAEPGDLEGIRVDAQAFLEILDQAWPDPALPEAARVLAERCDVPLLAGNLSRPYRRITADESHSLVAGLSRQGVKVAALLALIEGWPYQNVALDWLSDPQRNLAMIEEVMGQTPATGDAAAWERFRHHRDFIAEMEALMAPEARLWLTGWLDAVREATSWPWHF